MIVCDGKEYKAHRCFICAHSRWFERCCAGTFAEGVERKVELKEDLPAAVDRMIQYMYRLDYDEEPQPSAIEGQASATVCAPDPLSPMQMNAHMYAIADKVSLKIALTPHWVGTENLQYEIPGLQKLALKKFVDSSVPLLNNKPHLIAAACTVYNDISLPEDDRKLKDALIDIWIMGSSELHANSEDFDDIPGLAADLSVRFLKGFSSNLMSTRCGTCERHFNGHRLVRLKDESGAEQRKPV